MNRRISSGGGTPFKFLPSSPQSQPVPGHRHLCDLKPETFGAKCRRGHLCIPCGSLSFSAGSLPTDVDPSVLSAYLRAMVSGVDPLARLESRERLKIAKDKGKMDGIDA